MNDPIQRRPEFGSDLIVDLMRACGIEYAAINPGATFRGIHDSIVNYGGNRAPELILCNHEEIAVAIAHGYAKAKQKPMAAIVHNIVGLQHASMAIFNAWTDREPVIIMGGTGPVDSSRRRPWIDWVHTANVQGNQVRDYVKWDDQPGGIRAVPESFLRAYRIATQEPKGPVYLCYDSEIQEMALTQDVPVPDVARYLRATRVAPEPEAVERLARSLVEAEFPVLVVGRLGRTPSVIPSLVQLAEALGAAVIDAGKRHNFPSNHPLDLTELKEETLARADLIAAFEVYDLFGGLRTPPNKQTRRTEPLTRPGCKIAHISLNDLHTRSWVHDFNEVQELDTLITADTAVATPLLLELVLKHLAKATTGREAREARRRDLAERHAGSRAQSRRTLEKRWNERPISYPRLAHEIWQVIREYDWQLANGWIRGWARRLWDWEKPDCWLGYNEGGGLGYGMGASLGACLAHRGTDRLVLNLQSEGDFLFTPQAWYTASHHRLPLLTVVVDNHSYHNDEEHQEEIAIARGRPVENKVVGIRIEDPEVNYAKLAESFGVYSEDRIEDPDQIGPALRRALKMGVDQRLPAMVWVHCQPK